MKGFFSFAAALEGRCESTPGNPQATQLSDPARPLSLFCGFLFTRSWLSRENGTFQLPTHERSWSGCN